MKLFRVKVGVRPGHQHYVYPGNWGTPESAESKALNRGWGPIYESGDDDIAALSRERRSDGPGYDYLLIGLQDADVALFTKFNGTSVNVDGTTVPITVEEITKADAVKDHDTWIKTTEKINDQSVIDAINIKRAKAEELTDEELKAVDPEDSTPGIIRTKNLSEQLDEAGII